MITGHKSFQDPERIAEIPSGLARLECRLKSLSDREILGDLQRLNIKERKIKAAVLLYLAEFDRRRLYLPLGCGSLLDFCTKHLRYTRATAARRIQAARTAARFPEVLEMLRAGEISITTLSMVRGILDNKNILESIRNRSVREVEMLVARHRPVAVLRDSVRPVCVMRPIEASGAGSSTDLDTNNSESTPSAGTDSTNANVGISNESGLTSELGKRSIDGNAATTRPGICGSCAGGIISIRPNGSSAKSS